MRVRGCLTPPCWRTSTRSGQSSLCPYSWSGSPLQLAHASLVVFGPFIKLVHHLLLLSLLSGRRLLGNEGLRRQEVLPHLLMLLFAASTILLPGASWPPCRPPHPHHHRRGCHWPIPPWGPPASAPVARRSSQLCCWADCPGCPRQPPPCYLALPPRSPRLGRRSFFQCENEDARVGPGQIHGHLC